MSADLGHAHFAGIDLEEELGRGAYSIVYRAWRGGRECAVKVPRWPGRWTKVVYREAVALARVRDPGLPAVLEVGEADGLPYLVMELARGETLADRLERGPMSEAEALDLAAQLARILDAVHAAGLVHRDVKPRNIILEGGRRVRLVDFGFAAPTEGGVANDVAGTRAYAAPEQMSPPAHVDGRADLYALGSVLLECLTGLPPRDRLAPGSTRRELAAAGVGDLVARVITDLCAIDVAARYPDARAVRRDIEAVAKGQPPLGPRAPGDQATRRPLVGRRAEMVRLVTALDDARSGTGSVIVLIGTRGAGKTRALSELHDTARRTPATSAIAVSCAESDPPLGVVRRLIAALVALGVGSPEELAALERVAVGSRELGALAAALRPTVAELLGHAADRPFGEAQGAFLDAIGEMIARALRRRASTPASPTSTSSTRPQAWSLLVAIDDLHLVDAASREVLVRLCRRAGELPVLFLLACREGSLVASQLAGVGAGRAAAHELRLRPLDLDDVVDLVAQHLGVTKPDGELVGRVAALGNSTPLGVLEIVGTFLDEGALRPHLGDWKFDAARADSIRLPRESLALLGRRLEVLPEASRSVCRAAAVIGSTFSDDVLARVVGIDVGDVAFALVDALRSGILVPAAPGSYRFLHDTLREALLEDLGAADRASLHQRVAEALDTDPAGESIEGSVDWLHATATHYALGEPAKAPRRRYRIALAAAESALGRCDNETALRFYEVARESSSRASIALDSSFFEDLGEAHVRVGALDASIRAFESALSRATSAQQRASVFGRIASVQLGLADERGAASALARAFGELNERAPVAGAWSAAQAGVALARAELGPKALPTSPGEISRIELLCELHRSNCRLGAQHEKPGVLIQSTLRMLELSRHLGPSRYRACADALAGVVLGMLGQHKSATQRLVRAQRMAASVGDPASVAFCLRLQAVAACWVGDFDLALELSREWLDRYSRWTEVNELCMGALNAELIEAVRGRPRAGWSWLERAIHKVRDNGRTPLSFSAVLSHRVRATLAALGRQDEVSELFASLPGGVGSTEGQSFLRTLSWGPRARAFVESGDLGPAFEALVADFQAAGLKPRFVHPTVVEYYIAVAHARVDQVLAAPPSARARPIAALVAAAKDLRAAARLPLFKAHSMLVDAYLAAFRGSIKEARSMFGEVDSLGSTESSPWIQYGAARGLAHLLRNENKHAAARDKARVAELLAIDHGAVHRARRIREEFGLPATSSGSSTRSAPNETVRSSHHRAQLSSLLAVVRAPSIEVGIERRAARVLGEVLGELSADRGCLLFTVASPPAEVIVTSGVAPNDEARATREAVLRRVAVSGITWSSFDARGAAAPLRLEHRVCGAIYVERNPNGREIDDEDRSLLDGLASDAGALLELARLLDERGRVSETLGQAQRMEAVGELATGVAQDLDNVLHQIDAAVRALRTRALLESQEAELNAITRASLRISRIKQELGTLSGRDATSGGVCDPHDVLADFEPALRQLVGVDVELSLELTAHPSRVEVDVASFERALVNLVLFARDRMMRRGALRLTTRVVGTVDGFVAAGEPSQPSLELTVADTGPALTPEADLFAPAHDAGIDARPDRPRGGGASMRLANVYALAKSAGGTFATFSSEDGATFRLRLPLARMEPEPTTEPSDVGPSPRRGQLTRV